jgi:hypothetical protein
MRYVIVMKLSRHSSMDAGIQLQGYIQANAILGFWIAANPRYALPAAMTRGVETK